MELNILKILSTFGYPGMFFLIFAESILPPIPSEAILTFGGFMTEHTSLKLQGLLISATAGSLAGAIVLYGIGRLLPVDRIDHILSNPWIQKVGFKEGDVKKTLEWFNRHRNKAVLFGRCIPVIRSLISIPAGMDRMPLPRFLLYTMTGSGIWNFLLLSLGKKTGDSWHKITEIFQQYTDIVMVVMAAVTVLFVTYKLNTIPEKD